MWRRRGERNAGDHLFHFHYSRKREMSRRSSVDLHPRPSTCARRVLMFILIVLTLISVSALFIVRSKIEEKQRLVKQKQKNWIEKWKKIAPFAKKLPLGSILGFLRNLLILAIERQIDDWSLKHPTTIAPLVLNSDSTRSDRRVVWFLGEMTSTRKIDEDSIDQWQWTDSLRDLHLSTMTKTAKEEKGKAVSMDKERILEETDWTDIHHCHLQSKTQTKWKGIESISLGGIDANEVDWYWTTTATASAGSESFAFYKRQHRHGGCSQRERWTNL